MLGGKNKQSPGYTIVEVMIVLAISGTMFLIASQFVNGRQAKTSFSQGVNSLSSQIQNTIEQVSDGNYSDIAIKCTYGTVPFPTDPNQAASPGSGPVQGVNPQCVFLGKSLHFATHSPNFTVYSLAGGRGTASQPITTLNAADPTIITLLTDTQALPQSMQVNAITDVIRHTNYSDLAFFQSIGGNTVSLYYVTFGGPSNLHAISFTPINSARICLSDGGNQYAEVLIGNSTSGGTSLTSTVQMDGANPC